MSEEERKPLNVLAETLGARDWRAVAAAERTLLAAGDAGVAAVLAGLRHADPRAADALRRLLESGNGDDTALRRLAHGALKRQDPAYRDLVSRQARERAATAPVAP